MSAEQTAAAAGTTDARKAEYTTYAPKGERCRRCGKPLKNLEMCRRVSTGGAATGPHPGLYEHIAGCGE